MQIMLWLLIGGAIASPTWNDLIDEKNWSLHKVVSRRNVGEISVYKKLIDNFPCYKGEGVVQGVSAESLLSIAIDAESATKWSSANVIDAKTLANSPITVDYFQYIDVPLFSDRFWFLRGNIIRSEDTIVFHWDRLEQGGPHMGFYSEITNKYPNAIEPPLNVGGWYFKGDQTSLRMKYLICTHPGGSVPKGLQSIGTAQTLPNNLEDLYKEAIRRGK